MSVNRPSTSDAFNSRLFERTVDRLKSGNKSFIAQLESTLSGNRDGKINKAEAQESYDKLLAQAGNEIPQDVKNRFKDGQAFADQFEQIDPLGVADGYIDEGEFSEFLSSKADTPPSKSSAEEPPKPEPEQADD